MKNIEILGINVVRGPNMWTYQTVLEAVIDIGELEDFPSNTLPGFTERLVKWIPSLIEHRCSYGERGGFVRRLEEGTWPGHILEHVALELQDLAGYTGGGFGKAREVSRRGVYKVIVRAWHEEVTRATLYAARDLVMAAIEDRPFDVAAAIEDLRIKADQHCLGPSTSCIVDAAEKLTIPATRLNTGNLVQLGYGSRQRRIWTAETDRTSAIAEGISRDKDLTKELLRQCGVPTPEGRIVHGRDEAWSAAQDIGMPVVVKPSDGNHGRGVFVNLDNREEILSAYDVAATQGSAVIVERFIPGNEHRLLIVGNKLAAAAKGESAYVVGDGRSTILELIEVQLNSDPLRGEHGSTPLNLVRLDSMNRIEIERQGFAPDSIPPAGHSVLIQRHGNVVWEITDRVHPSTAATAALAARIVGLDIAGIDLVVEDISRPLAEQGGAIVEVNAGPGLHMHIVPAGGKPQPVGDIIARHLFPNGDRGRIPIVGITGNGGNTGIARIVAHLLQLAGNRVGLACRDGLFTNRRTIETTDCANWPSAHRVLINRAVDAGVFENGPWTMAAEGLAYDRCLVGVVTGMDPELRIPECHIETEDHVFKVLRTQVDIVLREGTAVLNADDPRVLEMVELSEGQVMLYSGRAGNDAIRAHCAAGGRAMFARDGVVLLADATGETALGRISSFPCVMQDPAKYSAETVVAAITAAVALGITPDLVRAGLAHFDPDRQFSPPPAALATVAAALREGGR